MPTLERASASSVWALPGAARWSTLPPMASSSFARPRSAWAGVALAACAACAACGDRTALLAGGAEVPADAASAVVAIDASEGTQLDAQVATVRDAGREATVLDAGRADAGEPDASCAGTLESAGCSFGVCCTVAFTQRCGGRTYSGGALCPATMTDAGLATFTGGCFVDGAQVGSFAVTEECAWCSTNFDGLAAAVETACGFTH